VDHLLFLRKGGKDRSLLSFFFQKKRLAFSLPPERKEKGHLPSKTGIRPPHIINLTVTKREKNRDEKALSNPRSSKRTVSFPSRERKREEGSTLHRKKKFSTLKGGRTKEKHCPAIRACPLLPGASQAFLTPGEKGDSISGRGRRLSFMKKKNPLPFPFPTKEERERRQIFLLSFPLKRKKPRGSLALPSHYILWGEGGGRAL